MLLNRLVARIVFVIVLLAFVAFGVLAFLGLPDASERWVVAAASVVGGLIVGAVPYFVISRLPERGLLRPGVMFVVLAAIAAVPGSMFWPGTVTFSRFGLVVYGVIPVPGMDLTVSGSGVLGFRSKNHRIERRELEALATDGVEMIIVGTGFQGVARLVGDVKTVRGVPVVVLTTPEAFTLFNRMKREGRRVALLAHSTC